MDCKYIAFLITFELYVGFFPKLPLISLNNLLFWAFLGQNLRKKYINDTFFSTKLIEWYENNKRLLPWRLTNDPYHIWLSEIILQQTRVDQGTPYYYKFVENYPRVSDLASSSEDDVLKNWQGLGYYSRARNLHAAAKTVMSQFGGKFPTLYKDVRSLKGVGDYTAAAIMSFAYNEPHAAVDGNVYRVLSRIFGIDDYIDTAAGKKVFQNLADELIDEERPGIFNQAMMDFGSLQCVPKSPNCVPCPFVDVCIAQNENENRIAELPKKKGKVQTRNRYFNYIDIRKGDKLYLRKRAEKDIWQNLYELPLIETEKECSLEELSRLSAFENLFNQQKPLLIGERKTFKHILSHQVIYASFYKVVCDDFKSEDFEEVKEEDLINYGVSRLIDKYLES